MRENDLLDRTKVFAIDTIRIVRTMPSDLTSQVIAKQVLRSATSVGANYRAAHRAKSPIDMINKLKIVEEELDETQFWFEIWREVGPLSNDIDRLHQEADQLVRIIVASIKTLRARA